MTLKILKTPLLLSTLFAVLALYQPSNAAPPISAGTHKKIITSALGPHDGGGGSFVGLKRASVEALEEYFGSDAGRKYLVSDQNKIPGSELANYQVRAELLSLAENLTKRLEFLKVAGVEYEFNLEKFKAIADSIKNVEKLELHLLKDFDFKNELLKNVKDQDDFNKLVFVNIPNHDNPDRGILLVNMKNYNVEYRDPKKDEFIHDVNVGGRIVRIPHGVLREILLAHEILGLMGSGIDLKYQVSSQFAYYFSESFIRSIVTDMNNRCEEIDRSSFKLGLFINGLEFNEEKLKELIKRVEETMKQRKQLSEILFEQRTKAIIPGSEHKPFLTGELLKPWLYIGPTFYSLTGPKWKVGKDALERSECTFSDKVGLYCDDRECEEIESHLESGLENDSNLDRIITSYVVRKLRYILEKIENR